MSLGNFVSMTDHFNFILLANVIVFPFQVYPITMFHDPDVNRGSQALVDAHSRNGPYAGKKTVRQVAT